MFDIGDLVAYSTDGVCQIDDIYEQTIIEKTREYYKLHPVENNQHLTLNVQVTGEGISITEIMDEKRSERRSPSVPSAVKRRCEHTDCNVHKIS